MKLTTKLGKSLRNAAVMAFVVCAIAASGDAANASLYNLIPGGSHGTTASAPITAWTPAESVGGEHVSETKEIQLTSTPTTLFSSVTVTSMVEQGDPNNPYVNGISGSNALSLTFIYEVSNSSTSNGMGPLSLDGFTGWGIWYGSYTGADPNISVGMPVRCCRGMCRLPEPQT